MLAQHGGVELCCEGVPADFLRLVPAVQRVEDRRLQRGARRCAGVDRSRAVRDVLHAHERDPRPGRRSGLGAADPFERLARPSRAEEALGDGQRVRPARIRIFLQRDEGVHIAARVGDRLTQPPDPGATQLGGPVATAGHRAERGAPGVAQAPPSRKCGQQASLPCGLRRRAVWEMGAGHGRRTRVVSAPPTHPRRVRSSGSADGTGMDMPLEHLTKPLGSVRRSGHAARHRCRASPMRRIACPQCFPDRRTRLGGPLSRGIVRCS